MKYLVLFSFSSKLFNIQRYFMKKIRTYIIFAILAFLLLSTNAFAGATGKITGRVLDEQGQGLIGVNIYLEGTRHRYCL
jgi:hypothetical protein